MRCFLLSGVVLSFVWCNGSYKDFLLQPIEMGWDSIMLTPLWQLSDGVKKFLNQRNLISEIFDRFVIVLLKSRKLFPCGYYLMN